MTRIFSLLLIIAAVLGGCGDDTVAPSNEILDTTAIETTPVPGLPVTEDTTTVSPMKEVIDYTIRKGSHDSDQSFFSIRTLDTLSFRARFDESARYQTSESRNQGDLNKLYGISDCADYHHSNSARFAWRWFNDQLEIWAYTYNNGKRHFELITSVGLDVYNEYEINFNDHYYQFRVNNVVRQLPRYCSGTANGYQLYPYFGGDETAPHDILISIEEKR